MSVTYIFQDEYPWDVRVQKVTETLAGAGIDVHILSRNRRGLEEREQLKDHLWVHRTPAKSMPLSLGFPAFFSPLWLYAILGTVRRTGTRLIIVRDLPLSPAAALIGFLAKVPVLMDMAENYPALIQSTWDYRGPKAQDYLVRNPHLLRVLERIVVKRLDGILVVSEVSRKRVQKLLGKRKAPVWVVGNTPDLARDEARTESPLVNQIRSLEGLRIVYVGFIEAHRGIQVVIKALAALKTRHIAVSLILVGDGTYLKTIEALAAAEGVRDSLLVTGWVPREQVPALIDAAHIGIVPHFVTEHTQTTIPNKIFDYMARRKPVLATNALALDEIVSSAECGLIYQYDDPDDLARKLQAMASEPLRKRLGENGFEAIRKRYNWNVDREHLLQAVACSVG